MKQASLEPQISVGDELELQVYALAYGGEGIAKHQGVVVFVAGTFPGDQVRVKILQVKKRFARGELLELLQASGERITPLCSLAENCGGCTWQQLAYSAQLKAKLSFVENALQHLGRIKTPVVHAPIKSTPQIGYRHKIQIPFQTGPDGLLAGFYAHQSHQVVPMETCPVQPQPGNRLYKAFLELAKSMGYTGYSESSQSGDVRHLVIRVGLHTREILAIVVTRLPEVPRLAELAQELQQRVPELVGVVQNINSENTNIILGKTNKLISGRGFLYEEINGIRYRISAESFFQVNPHQLPHLAGAVVQAAGLTGKEVVADLFCGVGFLSFELAKQCRMVFGIENVGTAVTDAEFNKHLNGFTNLEFLAADANQGLVRLATKKIQPQVIVVDPPRKGCEPELLKTICKLQPNRVVYVSCNPVTLARDVRLLADHGYWLQQVQPLDMFPHTYHIESVATLVRKK